MTRDTPGPVDAFYTGDNTDSLQEKIHKVLEEQERLQLLKNLNKQGLCTRDILSFVVNQADLRTINKELDSITTSDAMKTKIKD